MFLLTGVDGRLPLVAHRVVFLVIDILAIVGFFSLALLTRASQNARLRSTCWFLAVAPWLAFAMFLVNALADSSPPVYRLTIVQSRFSVSGRYVPRAFLAVSSWNPSGQILTFPVTHDCYDRIATGDAVTVLEKRGVFRIPWIAGVAECHH